MVEPGALCLPRYLCFVFVFQAEDGIRDLVRSRGLGDVYKRQLHRPTIDPISGDSPLPVSGSIAEVIVASNIEIAAGALAVYTVSISDAVSYTHLTLPTIYSV